MNTAQSDDGKKWKILANNLLSSYGGFLIFKGNIHVQDCSQLSITSHFWKDVLKAWSEYRYYNPIKYKDILAQPIWNNSHLKIDHKVFFDKTLAESGIYYMRDIIMQNGMFKSFSVICNEYNCSKSSYLRYFAIVSAVGATWKKVLREPDELGFDLHAPFQDEGLENFLALKRPTQHVYNFFIKKLCKNNSYANNLTKWANDTNQTLENLILWSNRFLIPFKSTLDTKIRTFQFKFLHRRIATNDYLCKIGVKQTPLCNFCENDGQSLIHLFYKCERVKQFWNEVHSWMQEQGMTDSVNFSMLDVCFGIWSRGHELSNTLILYGKHFIYRQKYQGKQLIFQLFKKEIMNLEKVEKIIALRKGNLSFHFKKWQTLIYK